MNLTNGMLDYSNSLRVGSIVNYTCNETDGYVLTPPGSQANRTCSLNGWTGINADCECKTFEDKMYINICAFCLSLNSRAYSKMF